jgi:uncharacterized membrane-anchored protein
MGPRDTKVWSSGVSEQGNEQQAAASWSSTIPPMRFESVPDVDARYWTVMTLASIFGCNTGDDCSYYAGWNHWIGLGPLALIFCALLLGERRTAGQTQAWYWATVIVLRTAATNLADLATHTFGFPYLKVILVLAVFQALVVWPVVPRLLAVGKDRPARPATDGWYWLSLLSAGTLGTAMGDWVAEELHVSTGYGTILLGVVYGLVLAMGRRSRWTRKVTYWSSVVAVRAAGTTAGDWLAFREDPGLHNGLHLGLPLSTAISGALFFGCLIAWKTRTSAALCE